MNTKQERFRAMFNLLKDRAFYHTQKEAAEKVGYHESNVSAALKGNERFLTNNFLRQFNATFGGLFNEEWLINGTGEMLANSPQTIVSTGNNSPVVNGGYIAGSFNSSASSPDPPSDVVQRLNERIKTLEDANADFAKREAQYLEIIRNLTGGTHTN